MNIFKRTLASSLALTSVIAFSLFGYTRVKGRVLSSVSKDKIQVVRLFPDMTITGDLIYRYGVILEEIHEEEKGYGYRAVGTYMSHSEDVKMLSVFIISLVLVVIGIASLLYYV